MHMDDIISRLDKLNINDESNIPPPPQTAGKKLVWKTLCTLYTENKRLKEYILYILEHKQNNRESIPEWVY